MPPVLLQHSLPNNTAKTRRMDELSEITVSRQVNSNHVKNLVTDDDCVVSELSSCDTLIHVGNPSPPTLYHHVWLNNPEKTGKMGEILETSVSKELNSAHVKKPYVLTDQDCDVSGAENTQSQGHDLDNSEIETCGDRLSTSTRCPPGLEAQIISSKQNAPTTDVLKLQSSSPSSVVTEPQDRQVIFTPTDTIGTRATEEACVDCSIPTSYLQSWAPSLASGLPPCPLPFHLGVNSQNMHSYLSTLASDSTNQKGNKGGVANVPRLPPGLDTCPVPTEIPVSPAQLRTKFRSFEKLMDALKEKFPEHSR